MLNARSIAAKCHLMVCPRNDRRYPERTRQCVSAPIAADLSNASICAVPLIPKKLRVAGRIVAVVIGPTATTFGTDDAYALDLVAAHRDERRLFVRAEGTGTEVGQFRARRASRPGTISYRQQARRFGPHPARLRSPTLFVRWHLGAELLVQGERLRVEFLGRDESPRAPPSRLATASRSSPNLLRRYFSTAVGLANLALVDARVARPWCRQCGRCVRAA